eukprot:TRINITY_DN323_c0_g2_i1.p1 TRINITY_DN323_c0_g2~~TRINITY_DN323_c0_g2_i1.p1  ORF type:complete len:130 (+),score=33.58 TRINITY_DN323_c0_g2_i1:276-665(+)
MKDSQGCDRGRCDESDCTCVEYQKGSSNPCDYCGHYPTAHLQKGGSVSSQKTSIPTTTEKPITSSKPTTTTAPPPSSSSSGHSHSTPPPPAFTQSAAPIPHTAVSSREEKKPMKSPLEWMKDKQKEKKT